MYTNPMTPNIFFTSDEHHGHNNALKGWGNDMKARPWNTLEEMTEGLIDRHNAVVGHGDLVYHLGDMFWRTFGVHQAEAVVKRLNGNHYYILGNHEEIMEKYVWVRQQFIWVKDRAKIKVQMDPLSTRKQAIILDHFAGRVWEGSHGGSWQLYGHSHGELPEQNNLLSFDVGIDAPGNNWTPVSIETVAQRMALKGTPDTFNQHGNHF